MPRVVGNTVGIHNYELMLDVRFHSGGGRGGGIGVWSEARLRVSWFVVRLLGRQSLSQFDNAPRLLICLPQVEHGRILNSCGRSATSPLATSSVCSAAKQSNQNYHLTRASFFQRSHSQHPLPPCSSFCARSSSSSASSTLEMKINGFELLRAIAGA